MLRNGEQNTDENACDVLEGTVDSITYRNDNNGYTVMNFNDGGCITVAVGILPSVTFGDAMRLTGKFVTHKTYGEQFSVSSFEFIRPSSSEAVYKYLSSGAVKGIGPATAAKIIEKFGDTTLDVLLNEPSRLALIKGISVEKAKKMGEDFSRRNNEREIMLKFSALNISPSESILIYKSVGRDCVALINDDPYKLCDFPINFSFERVEAIAPSMGIERLSEKRLKAGAVYVLRHNTRNGHTCLPREKLCEAASRLLSCEADDASRAVSLLCDEKRTVSYIYKDTEFIFLSELYDSESYVAGRIAMLLNCPPEFSFSVDGEIDTIEKLGNITYEPQQRLAINEAFRRGILILTGGPGTGKTTTLKAIITIIEQHKLKYCLAAPTGRAAKRMMELTGRESKTLHRMLEVEWGEFDVPVFTRNEKNPLDADVVIVDELSMVDITLFEALLKSMRMGTRLIMVGDYNQLPAVGAGNVLGDLIDSGRIPSVMLTAVFRQAMKSLIITNAHRIIAGERPKRGTADDDFFLIDEESPKNSARLICELYSKRLPEAYGFDPNDDIQILCPSRKGETGTVNLNAMLCETVNPRAAGKSEVMIKGTVLRTGDKVMQIKNNYDIVWTALDGTEGTGIFNGDIGVLQSIDRVSGVMSVRFDDRIALYSSDDAEDLEPAYAVTVHKSQGSEYNCVIIPLAGVPYQLCYRNLLYTAVTRAKKLLVLIGSDRQITSFISNNKKHLRYSALTGMLKELDDSMRQVNKK